MILIGPDFWKLWRRQGPKNIELLITAIIKEQKIRIIGCGHLDHFLPFLLTLLLEVQCFCFSFCFETIGLTISETEFRGRKIAVSFLRYFLWKVLINFRICNTVVEDSYAFFFRVVF